MIEPSVCDPPRSPRAPEVQKQQAGTSVRLLGGSELSVAGEIVDLPESSQRFIAYLAMAGKPCERAKVAGVLWSNCGESRAIANLRATRWRTTTAAGESLADLHGSRLTLREDVEADTRVIDALGWQMLVDPMKTDHEVDVGLFFQELLPGWYDDWVLLERDRLAQLSVRFAEALAYEMIRRRRLAEALDLTLRLVGIDALREGSQRALIAVYCPEGSVTQARLQLEKYKSELAHQFGCTTGLSVEEIMANWQIDSPSVGGL